MKIHIEFDFDLIDLIALLSLVFQILDFFKN